MNELVRWVEGKRPDRPSEYTRAGAWIAGITGGLAALSGAVYLLMYYVPFRAHMCDTVYDNKNQSFTQCHRFMNNTFGISYDVILGCVLLCVLLALLTEGLRNIRR